MKLLNTLMLLIPLAWTISSCGEKSSAANGIKTEIIPVRIVPIEANAGDAPIAVSGQFTTDDEVILSFKTGGVINQILVKEGEAVHQGQVLATLDLTEINAQVQQAQLSYDKASRDYQRAMNLYKDSVATLEQVQNAKTGLELAKQQLNAARFNRGYSAIRAPKNGYVLKKLANQGQMASPGMPVLETNGAQSSNWMLRVSISDAQWAALKLNDKSTITMESLPGERFEGVVSRKSEGVDPVSGSFAADIKLIGNKPRAIASGMFGKAVITPSQPQAATASATWKIPYDALLDGDGSNGYVFATKDNKKASKIKVTIAGMEKDQVIISGGLQDAGSLIISGSAYLTDNSPIRVIQ